VAQVVREQSLAVEGINAVSERLRSHGAASILTTTVHS
jgi:hypothetical protein